MVDDIASHVLGDKNFGGGYWLGPLCERLFAPADENLSWSETYSPLLELLYRIGFLGLKARKNATASYSFHGYVDNEAIQITENDFFEVHRAFRSGLDMPYIA